MLLKNNILLKFLNNQNITGSELAKSLNLNQKTVSNHLNYLENNNILKSKSQGKNKLFSLNKDNKEIVKLTLSVAENLRTISFYKKHPEIKLIIPQLSKSINGIALIFGSYAKGTQTKDSDIDILIIGTYDKQQTNQIQKTYRKRISIKQYEDFKDDILTREATNNHVIIKNAEPFIEELLNEKNHLVQENEKWNSSSSAK